MLYVLMSSQSEKKEKPNYLFSLSCWILRTNETPKDGNIHWFSEIFKAFSLWNISVSSKYKHEPII